MSAMGEGPNDLDLGRYCNLLRLDLDDIVAHPQNRSSSMNGSTLRSTTVLADVGIGHGTFDW
jgi:hypothetical protein